MASPMTPSTPPSPFITITAPSTTHTPPSSTNLPPDLDPTPRIDYRTGKRADGTSPVTLSHSSTPHTNDGISEGAIQGTNERLQQGRVEPEYQRDLPASAKSPQTQNQTQHPIPSKDFHQTPESSMTALSKPHSSSSPSAASLNDGMNDNVKKSILQETTAIEIDFDKLRSRLLHERRTQLDVEAAHIRSSHPSLQAKLSLIESRYFKRISLATKLRSAKLQLCTNWIESERHQIKCEYEEACRGVKRKHIDAAQHYRWRVRCEKWAMEEGKRPAGWAATDAFKERLSEKRRYAAERRSTLQVTGVSSKPMGLTQDEVMHDLDILRSSGVT